MRVHGEIPVWRAECFLFFRTAFCPQPAKSCTGISASGTDEQGALYCADVLTVPTQKFLARIFQESRTNANRSCNRSQAEFHDARAGDPRAHFLSRGAEESARITGAAFMKFGLAPIT